MLYTVREASEKLGIPSSTIRFYDKKGLLPFVERSPNGVRVFTESDIAHLQDLLTLKEAGFSIKEISSPSCSVYQLTMFKLIRFYLFTFTKCSIFIINLAINFYITIIKQSSCE